MYSLPFATFEEMPLRDSPIGSSLGDLFHEWSAPETQLTIKVEDSLAKK
jgi:hypothetical protein